MSARVKEKEKDADAEQVNEVRLRGRLSVDPEERVLPSGDAVWTFRVVVGRAATGPARGAGRAGVDTLDCAVWSARVRRTVRGWRAGDVVEVEGVLRRRFFKASGATASRVEVDVGAARLIRRAASG